jgi:hemerythrin-like domain-containing protein
MSLSDTLVDEHRIIEQVLNCLERMMERCESRRRLEGGPARDAIVFFRGFIERCHYNREETQLLPAMRAIGISSGQCLDCSMRHRTERSRAHLDGMEAAIEPASAGDGAALKEFAEHARVYIGLLLEYIARQEDCLFPMIAQALPAEDRTRLWTALQTAGADDQHDSGCNNYVDLANRLADHFNVPRAVIAGSDRNRNARCSPRRSEPVG